MKWLNSKIYTIYTLPVFIYLSLSARTGKYTNFMFKNLVFVSNITKFVTQIYITLNETSATSKNLKAKKLAHLKNISKPNHNWQYTSHSAYVATDTELLGAKIDGSL